MTLKDEILNSFLNHEILGSQYGIIGLETPITIREALNSDIPIIKAIALIVDASEKTQAATENELRIIVLNYLNSAI